MHVPHKIVLTENSTVNKHGSDEILMYSYIFDLGMEEQFHLK
jgi:hypothetical protein